MPDFSYSIIINAVQLNHAFQIRKAVFVEEQRVPEEIELDDKEDEAIHFIVYDLGEPIATARIRQYESENNIVKVERVAVLKKYRGLGVGKELMNFIEKEIIKMGHSVVRLNAQRHAEDFYLDLGYEAISKSFYEAGIEHVAMEKKIEVGVS